MKRFRALFILFLLILLTGCFDDEDVISLDNVAIPSHTTISKFNDAYDVSEDELVVEGIIFDENEFELIIYDEMTCTFESNDT
ncbi:hypothetical protein J6A31_04670 [bacterium]|nr:hypothetical protein [bacterium]